MKNENSQLPKTLVDKKRKATEDGIGRTFTDTRENKNKRTRKPSHYDNEDDSYNEEGICGDHQFSCSPKTRRLAEQMGRQLSVPSLKAVFTEKKNVSPSYGQLCSPKERSLVRKMGSSYSPLLISGNLRSKSVSNVIATVVVEP
jgi:hypothetical protein